MGKNNTHNKMHTRYRNSYHIYIISQKEFKHTTMMYFKRESFHIVHLIFKFFLRKYILLYSIYIYIYFTFFYPIVVAPFHCVVFLSFHLPKVEN